MLSSWLPVTFEHNGYTFNGRVNLEDVFYDESKSEDWREQDLLRLAGHSLWPDAMATPMLPQGFQKSMYYDYSKTSLFVMGVPEQGVNFVSFVNSVFLDWAWPLDLQAEDHPYELNITNQAGLHAFISGEKIVYSDFNISSDHLDLKVRAYTEQNLQPSDVDAVMRRAEQFCDDQGLRTPVPEGTDEDTRSGEVEMVYLKNQPDVIGTFTFGVFKNAIIKVHDMMRQADYWQAVYVQLIDPSIGGIEQFVVYYQIFQYDPGVHAAAPAVRTAQGVENGTFVA